MRKSWKFNFQKMAAIAVIFRKELFYDDFFKRILKGSNFTQSRAWFLISAIIFHNHEK